jgi:dihydroflavonol-4-reductase
MDDQVLVTGGTGFIARWCIAELLHRGYRVRTTIRDPSKSSVVQKALSDSSDISKLSFSVCDLLSDDGWKDALTDCRFVLHPASTLGAGTDPATTIQTAKDGTLRVLSAALTSGVEHIVVTSAANASSPLSYRTPGVTDEHLWTDPDAPGIDTYRRSKTLAERTAWEYINNSDQPTTMTTILPGAVFGPILGTDHLGTAQLIHQLLQGKVAQIPKMGFEVVDVRDIADIHIQAMTQPSARGERFLATGQLMWFPEIARLLRDELGPSAHRVPTRSAPDFVIRLLAIRRPELVAVLPSLGRKNVHTTAKAKTLLGWSPRPASQTILDCARSLIENGFA